MDLSQFTPQEKQVIEQLYLTANEIIHGGAADSVVSRLRAGDPAESLAKSAAEITKAVEDTAEDAIGGDLPEGVLMVAGVRITDELTRVMIAAGIIDEADGPSVASQAFPMAVEHYAKTTEATPEKQRRAQADLEAFRADPEYAEMISSAEARRAPADQAAGSPDRRSDIAQGRARSQGILARAAKGGAAQRNPERQGRAM